MLAVIVYCIVSMITKNHLYLYMCAKFVQLEPSLVVLFYFVNMFALEVSTVSMYTALNRKIIFKICF